MTMAEGNILKMKASLTGGKASYELPIGEQTIKMDELIGKHVKLHYDGQINCISTGERIKKSYGQGFSYKEFMRLAQCDLCYVKPELCHFEKGTCREPEWAQKNCMIPHVVYLANTGKLKIGITRESQVPTRWIDQGASQALAILRVPTRHISGLLEAEIRSEISDTTNWREMLKGDAPPVDLEEAREHIYETYGDLIDEWEGEDLDWEEVQIEYPVLEWPKKVKSMSFDKEKLIEGTLSGIKGQYLIFDTGVLNIRKFQGYFLKLEAL